MTRSEFRLRYRWMLRSRDAEVPDEWLPFLVPLCDLVNTTILPRRREDFKLDIYCDRGTHPMSIDILMEPADIDMRAIEQAIDHAQEAVAEKSHRAH